MSGPEAGTKRDALRELVVASAGSGKTYQLSSRMIGLLASDVPPEEILASTFTRKAAGEILERVLRRLAEGALDAGRARDLAASLPAWAARGRVADPSGCRELLERLAGRLHLLQVYTLDAFFHRAVKAFSLELGLPGRWSVADDASSERLRTRAVDRVLEQVGPAEMSRILQGIDKGKVQASVHRALLDELSALHHEFRSLAPDNDDAWGFSGGPDRFAPADPEEWGRLARMVSEMPLPVNRGNGEVPVPWAKARDTIVEGLGAMDCAGILRNGLIRRIMEGGGAFSRHAIEPEVSGVLDRVIDRVCEWELHLLDRRAREMGAFVERYHAEVLRLRREEGAYEFGDLAFALLEGAATDDPSALYYRLDGEVRHLLLDEFQDTSVVQWRAMEPLVSEILSGYEEDRVVYLVGDPKQSIYGWRGGEPRILESIGERFTLERTSLARSWRSSPVVLDLVNRVFGTLPDNPVFDRDEEVAGVMEWMKGFEEHQAQFTERAGYWVVEIGPEGTDDPQVDADDDPNSPDSDANGDVGPETRSQALLRITAERVIEVHDRLPGASIGILTRRHKDGARILGHLRARGVEVSGEGGVPLTDSPAVLAVLALLRLTDHPGDSASRYLVAHTPLGPTVGLEDWASEDAGRVVASRVRARLVAEGYGAVVGGWVRLLLPGEGERDRVRLRQLAELASQWDERATLRAMDFVRTVKRERREIPGGAAIRIMTIHASKGLQFDAVVLPEMGSSWRQGRGAAIMAIRSDPAGPVERLIPSVTRQMRSRVPEAARAAEEVDQARLRDDLSSLYVAMTRARHSVHILLPPDGKSVSKSLSGAVLLRNALRRPGERAEPGTIWCEGGDPLWWSGIDPELEALRTPRRSPPATTRPNVSLAPSPRKRLLQRTTPSGMEGGDAVPLERILRRPAHRARDRGNVVHRWMEEIEWLPPEGIGALDHDRFIRLAREVAPGFGDAEELFDEFLGWLDAPDVAEFLDRGAWPEGTTARREVPFLLRGNGELIQGVADRVLRVPANGDSSRKPETGDRIVVIDWKTDAVGGADSAPLDERIRHYAPQLGAYRSAMARFERVDPDQVEGWLVFLAAGVRSRA